jgi:anti-anti-sigma factor
MSVSVAANGNVACIILSGGIDYATQDEFKKANKQALSMEGITEIHVDFSNANFLDSAGIRSLLILHKEANETGKSLFLLNCNDNMHDIFEIGGFDKVFKFK